MSVRVCSFFFSVPSSVAVVGDCFQLLCLGDVVCILFVA